MKTPVYVSCRGELLEQIGVRAADLVTRPAPAPLQLAAASQVFQNLTLGEGTGTTLASGPLINELAKQSGFPSALTANLRQLQEQLGGSGLSTRALAALREQYRDLVAVPALTKLVADLTPQITRPPDVTQALVGNLLPNLSRALASGTLTQQAREPAGREGGGERDESANEDD